MDPTEIYIDVSLASFDFSVSAEFPSIAVSLAPDQSIDVSTTTYDLSVS